MVGYILLLIPGLGWKAPALTESLGLTSPNTQTARQDLRMKADSNQFDTEVTSYVKCRKQALICLRILSENNKYEIKF